MPALFFNILFAASDQINLNRYKISYQKHSGRPHYAPRKNKIHYSMEKRQKIKRSQKKLADYYTLIY